MTHIITKAVETFGSTEKAHKWLTTECSDLGGKKPMDCLYVQRDTKIVDTLLDDMSR